MPSTTNDVRSSSSSLNQSHSSEKPAHFSYLKDFRVEQCPSFLQHKCTQHKPFTCFNWHFMNQRRRRPIKQRDGTFNYSADVYCTKYDETTGICSDGDDCQYLHRTAGDTERRYHLKYYKTGICIYDTDQRGFCVKNGAHCAFAHGMHDLRQAVYDAREINAMESNGANGSVHLDSSQPINGPNSLDRERNALQEDIRWQDNVYVLVNYKTELCKRPPRLCRQGYACPQYHNSKDKRRTPKTFKYRSTPCPNVKQGDEWGDPINCESGDNCVYCHTRTEQQFHPEIYKSTKCHDIQQTGYCPRGPFCAFAHSDTDETLANYKFADDTLIGGEIPTGRSIQNNNGGKAPSVASSLPDHYTIFGSSFNNTRSERNSTMLTHDRQSIPSSLGAIGSRPRSFSTSVTTGSSGHTLTRLPEGRRGSGIYDSNSPIFNSITASSAAEEQDYGDAAGTVGSMVESVLDDLTLGDELNNIDAALDKDLNSHHNHNMMNGDETHNCVTNSTSNMLGSAPMNIPGARLAGDRGITIGNNISPPHITGTSPVLGSYSGLSAFHPHNNSHASSFAFDPFVHQLSSTSPTQSASNVVQAAASILEINRLKEELVRSQNKVADYENTMQQALDAWKREVEDARRSKKIVEDQRDQLQSQVNELRMKMQMNGMNNGPCLDESNFENMSVNQLNQLKQKLKTELECVDKMCRMKLTIN